MPSPRKDIKLLAFFLPQYHPIPENNEWWGPGFTEWTNVTRGVPLFEGHYQPHRPRELGFYDLRLPEVRNLQAQLAREAGVHGFVYYHYWFSGRRLLERPFEEVLKSSDPDFPFCLCWANEPWSRNWDGNSRLVLMPQNYSSEDDENHIQYLIQAFRDPRYIKVNGKPLMLVYRTSSLPSSVETFALWRRRCIEAGFPGVYICSVQSFPSEARPPADFGADAAIEFKPNCTDHGPILSSSDPLDVGYNLHKVWTYDSMMECGLRRRLPSYPYFQGICPSWDNSVRRRHGAAIFRDADPSKYQQWMERVLKCEELRPQMESFLFINAWNEWAEGNHLEPCERFGKGYIEATKTALRSHALWSDEVYAAKSAQEISVIPNDHFYANIERDSHLSGWCVSKSTGAIADIILFAKPLGGEKYEIVGAQPLQMEARPDVAAVHGSQALLCGWRYTESPSPGLVVIAWSREFGQFILIGALSS
jgi:O-antigen biosynthesis protein